MYKIVLSGLLLTTMLQGAASSSSQSDLVLNCRSNYAPLAAKYSNPDVDRATHQHWYALNASFKRDRKQMALDELREARDAEIVAIKQLHMAKRRINYFEAQRLQLQQNEIVYQQAEQERLQRLLEQGQQVRIIRPRPQYYSTLP